MLSRLLLVSVLPFILTSPAFAQEDTAAPAPPAARPVPRPVVRSAPVVRPAPRPVVRSAPVVRPAPKPSVRQASPKPIVRSAPPKPRPYVQKPKPVQRPRTVIAKPAAPSRQVKPARKPIIVQRPRLQTQPVPRRNPPAHARKRWTKPPARTVRVRRPPAAIATAARPKQKTWRLRPPTVPQQPPLIAAAPPVSKGLTPATAPVFAATPYQQAQGSNPLKYLLPKAGGMIFPLAIPAQISSVFGWRKHPISGKDKFHTGTDIAAPHGTPVVATHDGRVEMADYFGGYGLQIVLHHAGRRASRYAHLSEIFVRVGQRVKQGKVIGLVGSTGYSTGPHLHYEALKRTARGYELMDPSADVKLALSTLIETNKLAGMRSAQPLPPPKPIVQTAFSGRVNAGQRLTGSIPKLVAYLF